MFRSWRWDKGTIPGLLVYSNNTELYHSNARTYFAIRSPRFHWLVSILDCVVRFQQRYNGIVWEPNLDRQLNFEWRIAHSVGQTNELSLIAFFFCQLSYHATRNENLLRNNSVRPIKGVYLVTWRTGAWTARSNWIIIQTCWYDIFW